jgi:hypothetical protein
LYFSSKEDMWRARELITEDLISLGILPIEGSYHLPYQRGGNYYEPELGHWRTWGYKYYSNLKISPEDVTIICPYCSSELSLRSGKFGEFYGCPSYPECSFTIPKLIIVETIETGYAEYERRKDHKIFCLKFDDKRITVEEKKFKVQRVQ